MFASRSPRSSVVRALVLALSSGLLALGCDRNDMHDEARLRPLEASAFFADGMSARPIPEGTVARGQLRADDALYTGRTADGQYANAYPFPITIRDLKRGQERYNIYCLPCHAMTGDGDGMIVRRGFTPPRSFHIPRLREAPPGYFVWVIDNGFGAMFSYSDRVAPEDRWRIAAYIKTLQLSQNAELATLPPELRQQAMKGPAEETEHE